MKLEQLRYFVKIVECHSFNQAARELFISQPALTKSIQALEQELGVILLYRSKQGTYPTKYGAQVYTDCKDILLNLEKKMTTWQDFRQDDALIAGDVHIAAIPVVCNFILENLIEDIHRLHPHVNIVLHDISMLNFTQELLLGRFNIGITAVDATQHHKTAAQFDAIDYHHESLLEDEYGVFLSTAHPNAVQPTLTKRSLKELTFYTYASREEKTFLSQIIQPDHLRHLNSLGNILQAVAENRGAALFLCKALQNNWYTKHDFICIKKIKDVPLLPSEHVLVWAPDSLLSNAEKAVVDYLRQNYSKQYDI